MRLRTALITTLSCILAGQALPAHGQPTEMPYQLTASELAEMCREDRTNTSQTMQNLICAGYITGVRDGVEIGAAPARQPHNLYCLPRGISRGDTIRLFQDYIAERPERGALPAAMVVALAFKERHPCPPRPAQ